MKPNGGPAFPNEQRSDYWVRCECGKEHNFDDVKHPGMSLRKYFAIHAPEPTEEDVRTEMASDRNRDPHNDRNSIRGKLQIIAALRYRFADAMIAEGEKE